MKLKTIRQSLTAAAALAAGALFAATETVGNYTWTYRINGNGAETYGSYDYFEGTSSGGGWSTFYPALSPKPSGSLAVPSTLGGKTVTSLGEYSFAKCDDLTSVTIPNSVTKIGRLAFAYCSSLTSVPIPNGVRSIGHSAFEYCSSLTRVTIPDGVANVDGWTFYKCSALVNVVIPSSVTNIADYAFYECTNLTSVTLPANLKSIGRSAFDECSKLTSVTVPENVTSIGDYAFYKCSSLETVRLPKRFEGVLKDNVFKYCSDNLTIIYYGEDNSYKIRFHRNNETDQNELRGFVYGEKTRLPSLNKLGWARRGYDFKGWATSKANAAAGKVWKQDWAYVTTAAPAGKTLNVYAVWALTNNGYEILFCRNDGSGLTRTGGYVYGKAGALPTASEIGWARRGYSLKGWATSEADAAAGRVWKAAGATVTAAANPGEVLTVYAVWQLQKGCYAIKFHRNDAVGTWRTVGFVYGEKTRMPSLANGLGWAQSGYTFKGWSLTPSGAIWKADWSYVSKAQEPLKTLDVYAIWQ